MLQVHKLWINIIPSVITEDIRNHLLHIIYFCTRERTALLANNHNHWSTPCHLFDYHLLSSILQILFNVSLDWCIR